MGQEHHLHKDGYTENGVTHAIPGSTRRTYYCANCDIAFLWLPVMDDDKAYCCSGCADGGPCCCDYSQYISVTGSGVIHYELDEEALSESSDSNT